LNPEEVPPLGRGELADGSSEKLRLVSTSVETLLVGKGEVVDESGGEL
jgi:hypothetical protein